MPKRVLFINGPTQDPKHRYFGWPTSLLHAIAPSVEAMRSGGIDLSFDSQLFDPGCWVDGIHDADIFAALDERMASVDILCASVTYDSLHPVLRLFRHARERRPDVITVLGGPHVDETYNLPQFSDAVLYPDLIDYVIAGDAELALAALLRGLSRGQSAPIWTEAGGPEGHFHMSYRGTTMDCGDRLIRLDRLPVLPIEMADNLRRRANLGQCVNVPSMAPSVEMVAQRGCVYSCECCSEGGIKPNDRSIQSIVAEVELRKQQGFRMVMFDDSTFGLYPHLPALLTELGRTGMKFGCLNRFDHLVCADLLDAYRNAGFVYFYCAVEQFDDPVLKQMTKAENTARMQASIRQLHGHGFVLGVSLLYGLPYETRESVERTLNFVGRWVDAGTIRLVSQSVLSFHPGTPAGRHLDKGFDTIPPNQGFPFDQFEEGLWYHPPHVNAHWLEWIVEESTKRFGQYLVRNRDLPTAAQSAGTSGPAAGMASCKIA